ncbi:phage major capsid protein [Gammaproteobacteria bacterium]|nr:phage major capsid protein [Gammaproteobacteria bacterium]
MSEGIKELSEKVTEVATELKSALDSQNKEFKSVGEASKETTERVRAAEEKFASMTEETKSFEKRLAVMEAKGNRPTMESGIQKTATLGEMFTKSEAYQGVKSSMRGNGMPVELKAITDGPASAGALTTEYRNPNIYKDPNRPIFIRDLVNHMPTMDSAVEVMRELLFSNNAAPQAGQLVAKAESDITFSQETYAVQTIAHWLPAARQMLSDVARLRSYIDGRLMYGLDLEMDQQLLLGDGTGQNFLGLLVDPAVTDIGASVGLEGEVMIDHIRKAVTACQLNEYYNINGVVLNPQDWEAIELAKGSDGHYIWVSVTQGGESRLWRVPVVITNAMPVGEFILGDWTMGATLYDREQKSVRVSESHADYFVRNGVVVLAEERAAFAIELPRAFTKGQFAVAP